MFKIIGGIVVVGIILYVIFGAWGLILPAAFFVVIIIIAIRDANKMSAPPKISVINNPNVENILQSHPELGNYKRYYGAQGILLILSENGYVAYFQGEDFTIKKINEVKSIKFIAQPFDRNIKKILDAAGTIHYRIDVKDFSNPIVDLPFAGYKDNADKLRQMTEFAEVKSTFDYIKKNAGKEETVKATSTQAIPVSNTPIDLSGMEKVCTEINSDQINYYFLSGSDYEEIREKLDEREPLTQAVLERNPPLKIVYTDKAGNKTLRDIIPSSMNGYVDSDEHIYSFFIDAFCLLRNEERSFHTDSISAAWLQGREINLGDYLADLCRKTKEYKEAVKKRNNPL